jgi:cell division protease FtsH
VDNEIRKLITDSYKKAKELLKEHRSMLDRLASALLEKEIIAGTELQQLFASLMPEPAT